jgi:hypothetical protein
VLVRGYASLGELLYFDVKRCMLALKNGAGFFGGVCRLEDRPLTSRDPSPALASRMVLYQYRVSGDSHRSESLFTAPISCARNKPQGGRISYSLPLDRRSYAGSWIWTSENSILLGTSVNKGNSWEASSMVTMKCPPRAPSTQ